MRKLLVMIAVGSGLLLSACNTVHGATEDVESVGDCVDDVDDNC